MIDLITSSDSFGLPVCFFLKGRRQHETFFGGVWSIITACLKITVVVVFLYNFLLQKTRVSTNFSLIRQEYQDEKFQDLSFEGRIITQDTEDKYSIFGNYFRIVLSEENQKTIYPFTKEEFNSFFFSVPLPMERLFGSNSDFHDDLIQILPCSEILDDWNLIWTKTGDKDECEKHSNFQDYLTEAQGKTSYTMKYYPPYYYMNANNEIDYKNFERSFTFDVKQGDQVTYGLVKTFIHLIDDTSWFGMNTSPMTYWSFGDCIKDSIESQKETDFIWDIQLENFSREQVLDYILTKNKWLILLGELGGIIHLLSYFSIIPKWWNEYYYQKSIINTLIDSNKGDIKSDMKPLSSSNNNSSLLPQGQEVKAPLVSKRIMRQEKEDWRYVTYFQWLKTAFCWNCVSNKYALEQNKKLKEVFSLEYYLERLRVIQALVDINEDKMNSEHWDMAKNNPIS